MAGARELDSRELCKDVAFAGTDRGVVQMSVTVPVSIDRIQRHVDFFNGDFEAKDMTPEQDLQLIKVPKAYVMTAKGLDNECGTSRHMNKMRQWKEVNGQEDEGTMS